MKTLKQLLAENPYEPNDKDTIKIVKEWLTQKRQEQYTEDYQSKQWMLAKINMIDELLGELQQ